MSTESEDVQFFTVENSEETKMSKESEEVQPVTAEMSEGETKTSNESKEDQLDTSGSLNIEKEEKMNCNEKKLTSGASCCVLM